MKTHTHTLIIIVIILIIIIRLDNFSTVISFPTTPDMRTCQQKAG